MSRFIFLLTILIVVFSCDSSKTPETAWDIRGNWYYWAVDMDSSEIYTELYINDSLIEVQDEVAGQMPTLRYIVRGDSILHDFGQGAEYIGVFKINRQSRDTIWLTSRSNSAHGVPDIYWVRFPEDEKGYFDHEYNFDTPVGDSLAFAVVHDFHRRRSKHYAMMLGTMEEYDSLLKAGAFDWNMSTPESKASVERRKKYREWAKQREKEK